MENREEADGYFPGWEDEIRYRVYGETADGISYEFQWALGLDGMEVYFSPYDIGPYVMGTVTVVIPYEEMGIISSDWIPDEAFTFPIRRLYQTGTDVLPATQQEEYTVDR